MGRKKDIKGHDSSHYSYGKPYYLRNQEQKRVSKVRSSNRQKRRSVSRKTGAPQFNFKALTAKLQKLFIREQTPPTQTKSTPVKSALIKRDEKPAVKAASEKVVTPHTTELKITKTIPMPPEKKVRAARSVAEKEKTRQALDAFAEKSKSQISGFFEAITGGLSRAGQALWTKAKSRAVIIVAVILLISAASGLGIYLYLQNEHYVVYVDGIAVAQVKELAELDLMIELLQQYGLESDGSIYDQVMMQRALEVKNSGGKEEKPQTLQATSLGHNEADSSEHIGRYKMINEITTEKSYKGDDPLPYLQMDTFKSLVHIETGAAIVSVNGDEVAILPDRETAQAVLDIIINSHLKERNNTEIKNYKVLEEVEITVKPVPPEEIQTYDMALNLLSTGYTERQVHIVQRGDSLWSIGSKNGMTVAEVKKCNPELTSNVLHLGQKIAIEPLIPYIHVETHEQLKTIEYVSYKTVYTEDNSLYTYQTKTINSGARGKNEVIYEIVRVNGIEQKREVFSRRVLSEPVTRVIAKGTKQPEAKGSGKFLWPVSTGGHITSPYGWRRGGFHQGVDISASTGTNIIASDTGIVTKSAYHRTYGYYIVVDHGNSFSTLYAHNSKLLKKVGAKVEKGDVIALSGNTGRSTGPHLHFEIRVNNAHKNPMNYFK